MPNLEGIGLQNFRTFKDKEYLEFAPITLITGTNNSGKSSVIKAIKLLARSFKDEIIREKLQLKGLEHELGSINRIINNETLQKIIQEPSEDSIYEQVHAFKARLKNGNKKIKPILFNDNDLVFCLPVKIGGDRKIEAQLEFRFRITYNKIENTSSQPIVKYSHDLKSISILLDDIPIHCTNNLGLGPYDEETGSMFDMYTSIDVKKIISLLLNNPIKTIKKENFKPNKKTDEYFKLNLYDRIEKYERVFFELPFFQSFKETYKEFIENFKEEVSLFSNYKKLSTEESKRLKKLEEEIYDTYIIGEDKSNYSLLECFQWDAYTRFDQGIVDKISNVHKKEEELEKEISLSSVFGRRYTKDAELFEDLMNTIVKEFTNVTKKSLQAFSKVYILPSTRSKGREWYIDEFTGQDNELVKNFAALYLERKENINGFINFWIGKGEINQTDTNGNRLSKGFGFGKEIKVERIEEFGLTRVYLVSFDNHKTPLIDLGYGISQLLPIIMKIALVASKHLRIYKYDFHEGFDRKRSTYFEPSTLIVEEPEANLHPSLQSKLAELLIDAGTRFNIQFIVETHSEYLIYKFQQYIGKKIIQPTDVAIYYLNHPDDVRTGKKEKYVNRVGIKDDGSIDYEKYFGTGFFDEQTNLKLSLLNVQRDRFIELFQQTKEKFGSEDNTLSEEQQFSKLSSDIDKHFERLDYAQYESLIKLDIDETKIDTAKTLKYLATGKYLLVNLDEDADFSPVIIQYGRAVEYEMARWINDFKSSLNPTDKTNWCNSFNTQVQSVINAIDNTILENGNIKAGSSLGNLALIVPYVLKNSINNVSNSYKFGNLIQIFELIHYISPNKNTTHNYSSVDLIKAFTEFSTNKWNDYSTAELLFNKYRYIKDERNSSAHGGAIKKTRVEAKNYIDKVEALFKCL